MFASTIAIRYTGVTLGQGRERWAPGIRGQAGVFSGGKGGPARLFYEMHGILNSLGPLEVGFSDSVNETRKIP